MHTDSEYLIRPKVSACISRLVEARHSGYPKAHTILALLRYIDNDEIRAEVERTIPYLLRIEDK